MHKLHLFSDDKFVDGFGCGAINIKIRNCSSKKRTIYKDKAIGTLRVVDELQGVNCVKHSIDKAHVLSRKVCEGKRVQILPNILQDRGEKARFYNAQNSVTGARVHSLLNNHVSKSSNSLWILKS